MADTGRQRGRDSEDLTEAIEVFERLPEREQVLLTARLLERAGGEVVGGSKLERVARARAEALLALDAAYAELGLTGRDRISKRQFEEVCAELGIETNYFKVRRAWGLWPAAVQVYLGAQPWDRLGHLAVRLHRRARVRQWRQAPRSSVLAWLAEERGRLTPWNYDAWRIGRNAELEEGIAPHLSSLGIARNMRTDFRDAVRRFRAGEGDPRVDEETVVICGHRLITAHGIGTIMNFAPSYAHDLERGGESDFPSPVMRIAQVHLWLLDDIERHRAGEHVESAPWRLSDLIYDTSQLVDRLDIDPSTLFQRQKKNQHQLFPPVGGVFRRRR